MIHEAELLSLEDHPFVRFEYAVLVAIFGSQGRLGPTRRSYFSSHSFTTP
jgi:hypothetical protein